MNVDQYRNEGTQTRLGRTVRATVATAVGTSRHREHHRRTNWLRDVILGGQDGLVNILGIILGVIAGGGSKTVLLAAGSAAAITESISMGAVGYTSSVSQRDYYRTEREREAAEIDAMPEAEPPCFPSCGCLDRPRRGRHRFPDREPLPRGGSVR